MSEEMDLAIVAGARLVEDEQGARLEAWAVDSDTPSLEEVQDPTSEPGTYHLELRKSGGKGPSAEYSGHLVNSDPIRIAGAEGSEVILYPGTGEWIDQDEQLLIKGADLKHEAIDVQYVIEEHRRTGRRSRSFPGAFHVSSHEHLKEHVPNLARLMEILKRLRKENPEQ